MFARLKDKFWGTELHGVDLPVDSKGRKARVFLWERDGEVTLNIRSQRFSYVQGPGRNEATLTFDLNRVDDLISLLSSAAAEARKTERGQRV